MSNEQIDSIEAIKPELITEFIEVGRMLAFIEATQPGITELILKNSINLEDVRSDGNPRNTYLVGPSLLLIEGLNIANPSIDERFISLANPGGTKEAQLESLLNREKIDKIQISDNDKKDALILLNKVLATIDTLETQKIIQ